MNPFNGFQPKDFIAVIIVIGVLVLTAVGVQPMIPSAVMLILGYYFAKRGDGIDNGK